MDMDFKSLRVDGDFMEHFFDFENMTFLDLFDMYLMNFDISSQYLIRFSQYLVNILDPAFPTTFRLVIIEA